MTSNCFFKQWNQLPKGNLIRQLKQMKEINADMLWIKWDFLAPQNHSHHATIVGGPKMVSKEPLGCHKAQFDNHQFSPTPSLLQMRKLKPREAKFRAKIQIPQPYVEDSLGERDDGTAVGCLVPTSEKSEAGEIEAAGVTACVQLGTYQ